VHQRLTEEGRSNQNLEKKFQRDNSTLTINSFLPANTFHYTFMSFAEGDGSAIEPYEWATGFSQQTGFSEFNFTLVPQAYYILFYRAIDGSGNFEDWNQFVFNSGFGQNQVDNPGGGGPGDDCPPGEDCEL